MRYLLSESDLFKEGLQVMRIMPMFLLLFALGVSVLLAAAHDLLGLPVAAAETDSYEVWVIDQADAARGGSRLYIFKESQLKGHTLVGEPEVINLDAAVRGVGDGPGVRPHLLAFNRSHSHALIANVASGHVYIMRASDRRILASIDVGEQAHGAEVSPDDSMILVANQNGKRLARIRADFSSERFTYEPEADLDLKAWESTFYPDNAPICPLLFADPTTAYVTMRGGGIFVVDVTATPMRVLRSFGNDQVAPAGCGGVRWNDRIYVNSATADSSHLYVLEVATGHLIARLNLTPWGTDAHGLTLLSGRFLWVGQRGRGDNATIFDITTHGVLGTIPLGPGPDIMEASPSGDRVFVALRGPNNLTGGPPAKGETPGFVVLKTDYGGATAVRTLFVPIGDQTIASPNDPHALAVRRIGSGG